MNPEHLLIVGASARAAAFSALRAGLRPWCIDLFADRDLQLACPAQRLDGRYPQVFLEAMDTAPPGPWMYTGGMENHPGIVARMARKRQLWGTDGEGLLRSRDPFFVHGILSASGLPVPAVREDVPEPGRWLRKPRCGAGGTGIRFCDAVAPPLRGPHYFQEFVDGQPAAALYVGDGQRAEFLGASCQLVGASWLHARPFQYCGSIGPLPVEEALTEIFRRLGNMLTTHCHLRGLFGVDGVLRDGVFWPVEINPRYTASVEVLEHAAGVPAMQLHAGPFPPSPARGEGSGVRGGVFGRATPTPPAPLPQGERGGRTPTGVVGKGILFARADLQFPPDGPWLQSLTRPPDLGLPAFADIPQAGEVIPAGRPVLSFFTRAPSLAACEEQLRQIAIDLDRRLFQP
jgi:predicted ATP-grasp superfamily ATP-dependent carboligase